MSQKFVRNLQYKIKGPTDSIQPDIDELRSLYPSNILDASAAGKGLLNLSASSYLESILPGVSTRYFILQGLALNNKEIYDHHVVLYDGVSSSVGVGTALGFQIMGSTTEFITDLNWVFHSGVYARVTTSVAGSAGSLQLRVQGLLVASHT